MGRASSNKMKSKRPPGESASTPAVRRRRRRRWYEGKKPVFRFVLFFGAFMGLFELAYTTAWVSESALNWYLEWNASASGSVIDIFEETVNIVGKSISVPGRYALSIERGCDAVEPSALFCAGVLAFPASFLSKLPGMLIGTICLMVLNIFRIVSLFYIGAFYPRAFDVMHVDVWQALFVFLAIAFWIYWAMWATREQEILERPAPDPG